MAPKPANPTIHPHEPDPEDAIVPPPEKRGGLNWWLVGFLIVALVGAVVAFLPLPI